MLPPGPRGTGLDSPQWAAGHVPTKGASGCILGGGRLRSSPTSGPLRKERGLRDS